MIGSCAVRLFMNPSTADDTAQKLSNEIGYQESILDASRQKIVEPQVLAGPEYEDFVLVLEANKKPYRLRKHPIDKDAELKSRMGSL
jgi:type IV secretion system protein VirD4